MKKINCLVVQWLLLGYLIESALGGTANYQYKGADWLSGSCHIGEKQSPINIDLELAEEALFAHEMATGGHRILNEAANPYEKTEELEFEVEMSDMKSVQVQDLISTIQVPYDDGSLAFWDEEGELHLFNILQFHFHSPSEHTFDHENYDLELHVVHKNYEVDGLAVLAIYFDREAGGEEENHFIDALQIENINRTKMSSIFVPEIPLFELIKGLDKEKLFHYEGSLTTPPCSEIVQWIIIHDPQHISEEQLAWFQERWQDNDTFAEGMGNNRITQPLHARKVYMKATSNAQALTVLLSLSALLSFYFL